MKGFVIAAALATALGLSVPGTAHAQRGRFTPMTTGGFSGGRAGMTIQDQGNRQKTSGNPGIFRPCGGIAQGPGGQIATGNR